MAWNENTAEALKEFNHRALSIHAALLKAQHAETPAERKEQLALANTHLEAIAVPLNVALQEQLADKNPLEGFERRMLRDIAHTMERASL